MMGTVEYCSGSDGGGGGVCDIIIGGVRDRASNLELLLFIPKHELGKV